MASTISRTLPFQFLDEEGNLLQKISIPLEQILKGYHAMLRIRLLDERMITLQRQGRIGFYGAASGEEAAVIGSAQALEPEDWVYPALRQGGVLLYRGLSIKEYICQVMGNQGDIHKGHQMPCHYSHKKFNHVAWSSCMATQLPHAVGTAYAMKLSKEKKVVMAYLGDGATSEGDFHVAMNFAGVFKVPVVFFCHNNQWAISVPFEKQTASESLAIKAKAYGFEGVRVDGNDLLACYEAAKQAVEKARAGKGPSFIEAITFRMGAHSTSDDPKMYRDEALVESWKRKDPILRLKNFLKKENVWDEKKEEALLSQIHAEINKAIEEAEALPPPSLETLFDGVYEKPLWHLEEQEASLKMEKISSMEKLP
jgi:pyruvate dehydrogenase E1 component alpha subunit